MSQDEIAEDLRTLRVARDELSRVAEYLHLPQLDPAQFISSALPMSNVAAHDGEDDDVALAAKAEAYFLVKHGELINAASTLNSELTDLFAVEKLLRNLNENIETEELPKDVDKYIDTADLLKDSIEKFWQQTNASRFQFRRMLEIAYSGKRGSADTLAKYIDESIQELVLVPSLTWEDSSPKTTIKYAALDVCGVLGYTLILLLDRRENRIELIRKCKLCDGFFMLAKGGRPRLYCTDEHRVKAAALTGAERTAKWRKNKAKEAKQ